MTSAFPTRPGSRSFASLWILTLAAALPGASLYAETLPTAGPWQSDRVKLTLTSEAWAPSCGARPQGHDWKVSADRFELVLRGAEFSLRSKRRTIESDGCEGPSAKLRRVGHEVRDGVRRTRCQAPEVNGQPEEDLRHAFKLLDADHLLYVTEGTRQILPPRPPEDIPLGEARGAQAVWYSDGTQWKKGTRSQAAQAQRCVLRLRREEKLERVVETAQGCSTAGPAHRLTLTPSTLDLAPGQRHCFELKAFDIDGCPTAPPQIEVQLSPGALGSIDKDLCVSLRSDIDQAAALAVTARALVLRATALIRVTPTAQKPDAGGGDGAAASHDAQVDTPDLQTLVAQSQDENVRQAARDLIGGVGVRDVVLHAPAARASRATVHHTRARHPRRPRAKSWLRLVMALATLLAFVVVWYRRRAQRRSARDKVAPPAIPPEPSEAPMASRAALPEQGEGLVCPTCHFEFDSGTFCPYDRDKLVPLQREARHTMFIPQMGGMICPVCQTRYPTKARFCGKDRSPLLPDLGDSD